MIETITNNIFFRVVKKWNHIKLRKKVYRDSSMGNKLLCLYQKWNEAKWSIEYLEKFSLNIKEINIEQMQLI